MLRVRARAPRTARSFAFDIFNPSIRCSRAPGRTVDGHALHRRQFGEMHLEATMDYDAATQVNRGAWRLSAPGKPDFLTVPLHLRSIFPQELPMLLAANGFQLEARNGDFRHEPFTSESPRQVCICRRVG